MDKPNNRRKKTHEDINDKEIIDILDSKKHIPIQIRKLTSGILKSRLQEHENWEKETNAASIHIEHLQEEINEKNIEIEVLKKIIKKLEDEIKMEKNKNNEFIIKQENIKNNIKHISELINKIEL